MTDAALQWALEYARQGWPVFPIGENKLPAVKKWETVATTDEKQIRDWFEQSFIGGCNFGFCPGRAGIVVIDLDVAKKIKRADGTVVEVDGATSLAEFEKAQGQRLPATYTVMTPSGGKHLYFKAEGLRSKNHYLDAVDVKSCGGYVLVPGSGNAKGQYRALPSLYSSGEDVVPLPDWFAKAYGHRKTEKEKPVLNYNAHITPDTPDKIDAGRTIIEEWPVASEGERNDQLFQLSRELCKAGVSYQRALELYTEYGLDRIGLDPDSHEVSATIKSAYGDLSDLGAESEEGRMLTLRLFDELPPEEGIPQKEGSFGVDWTELEGRPVPERRWFIENWLSADEGYTVLYSGRGGTGKSATVIDLMRCLATGEPWCGMPVLRGGKSMLISCEDSEEELTRRVQKRVGLSGKVPKGVIRLVSRLGCDNALCLADRTGRLHVTPFYHELREQAGKFFGLDGGVLILDTVSDVYAGNENDRSQVSQFVKGILNRLGRDLGVTIIVIAHPAKGGAVAGQGFSGSTAWEGAFRCRWELNYRKADQVDGQLELVLAKSNSTKPGQKIVLENRGGIHYVVDSAHVDEEVKGALLSLIADAYAAGNPFGRGATSARPIEAVDLPDPITGDNVPETEIKQLVVKLLAEGRIEAFRTNKLRGLRPVEGE